MSCRFVIVRISVHESLLDLDDTAWQDLHQSVNFATRSMR
jgi:hypothetical protein